MVKDGIAVTMEKAFIQIGFSPNSRLRLLLSVFNYLSKNSKLILAKRIFSYYKNYAVYYYKHQNIN